MTKWEQFGDMLGRAIGEAVESVGLGDAVRAAYARRFGVCRRCQEVLGGASPDQVCEECAADETCGVVWGGGNGGDA